jgi:hypothetical protein
MFLNLVAAFFPGGIATKRAQREYRNPPIRYMQRIHARFVTAEASLSTFRHTAAPRRTSRLCCRLIGDIHALAVDQGANPFSPRPATMREHRSARLSETRGPRTQGAGDPSIFLSRALSLGSSRFPSDGVFQNLEEARRFAMAFPTNGSAGERPGELRSVASAGIVPAEEGVLIEVEDQGEEAEGLVGREVSPAGLARKCRKLCAFALRTSVGRGVGYC